MITRRRLLLGLATAVAAGCRTPPRLADRILDTHTHFYDPTRPGGVPWPPSTDPVLFRPHLPATYFLEAAPLGIHRTVVVEASPLEADNDWVLERADADRRLAGLVGHLKPGTAGFAAQLDRACRDPRFRGIRVGTWDRPIAPKDRLWMKDLARVADAGRAVDVILSPRELPHLAGIARDLPSLHLVINHGAGVRIDGAAPPPDWCSGMEACARASRRVIVKVSGLVEGAATPASPAPSDASHYAPVLDFLRETFGPQRMAFGSNWPVCTRFAPLSTVVGIVRDYLADVATADRRAVWNRTAEHVYRPPSGSTWINRGA